MVNKFTKEVFHLNKNNLNLEKKGRPFQQAGKGGYQINGQRTHQ